MPFGSGRRSKNLPLKFYTGQLPAVITLLSSPSIYTYLMFFSSGWLLTYIYYCFRLRAPGQPFIAFDPGMTREALAYHGCAELFQVIASNLDCMMNSLFGMLSQHLICICLKLFPRMCTLNSFSTKDIG